MSNENSLHAKIRNCVLTRFGRRFDASVVLLKTIEEPARFNGPVVLAVVSMKASEKDVVETLSKTDPVDIEQMRKQLEYGDEVACIFDSSGEELERHFRGIDYFFDYQKIKI